MKFLEKTKPILTKFEKHKNKHKKLNLMVTS